MKHLNKFNESNSDIKNKLKSDILIIEQALANFSDDGGKYSIRISFDVYNRHNGGTMLKGDVYSPDYANKENVIENLSELYKEVKSNRIVYTLQLKLPSSKREGSNDSNILDFNQISIFSPILECVGRLSSDFQNIDMDLNPCTNSSSYNIHLRAETSFN